MAILVKLVWWVFSTLRSSHESLQKMNTVLVVAVIAGLVLHCLPSNRRHCTLCPEMVQFPINPWFWDFVHPDSSLRTEMNFIWAYLPSCLYCYWDYTWPTLLGGTGRSCKLAQAKSSTTSKPIKQTKCCLCSGQTVMCAFGAIFPCQSFIYL